jgi:K+/H+ antiporter YhaU regulatory subunit KhtT
MVNPDPAFPLQPGDRLVMLGSPEQVRAAEVLLESGV